MLPASQVSPKITSNKLWSSFSSSCGGWAETLLGHWEHGGVVGAKGKGNHLSKSINFSWNNVVIEHLRLRLRGSWRRSWWNWIHRRYTTSTRADTRSYSLRRGWILNIIKIESVFVVHILTEDRSLTATLDIWNWLHLTWGLCDLCLLQRTHKY